MKGGRRIRSGERAGTRGIGIATGLDDLRAELAALGLAGEIPVVVNIDAAVEMAMDPE